LSAHEIKNRVFTLLHTSSLSPEFRLIVTKRIDMKFECRIVWWSFCLASIFMTCEIQTIFYRKNEKKNHEKRFSASPARGIINLLPLLLTQNHKQEPRKLIICCLKHLLLLLYSSSDCCRPIWMQFKLITFSSGYCLSSIKKRSHEKMASVNDIWLRFWANQAEGKLIKRLEHRMDNLVWADHPMKMHYLSSRGSSLDLFGV
jgi:hypothetical protein